MENKQAPFDQIHIVEASAGSGKTYTLARRYIQLLLGAPDEQNIPLRQILAITFTNKAAFEMKQRVLEFLKKTALEKFSPEEQKNIISGIPSRMGVKAKAHLAMEHLIRNYNFFQVQTIDSFINALLSGCAYKIDLSARFKIMRNSREYLQYSLDELIDRATRDPSVRKVFDKFLNQYLFIENKTNWFPKKDILALLGALFYYGNLYGANFTRPEPDASHAFAAKNMVLGQIKELYEHLPEGTNGRFVTSMEKFLADHSGGFDVDDLSEFFLREDFPVNKGRKIPGKVEKLWGTLRLGLRDLVEIEAFHVFDCYMDIFDLIMEDFRKLALRDDVLFLEELNRKARRLFDEDMVTVAELYYRLAGRFRHYLIDEFQDTSLLQWKNLYLMIEEALSTGGTLFYVGDKKQAIYRFRGGEVSLFNDAQKELGVFTARHELLAKNYRSQKEIVVFNNDIFSPENLSRFLSRIREDIDSVVLSDHDRDEILDVFKDARQSFREDKTAGFVRVIPVNGADKDERREMTRRQVLATIRDLSPRFSYGDMAVLTRDNDEVTDVTGWLLEASIPVESDRTLNIKEHFLIKEIISLLKFLSSPIDNLSFVAFATGDIFASASGLPCEEMHRFFFDLHRKTRGQRDVHYYKEFRRIYPDIWEKILEEFFKRIGFYPLYELVVSIFHKFDIPRRFPGAQGFLMRFLELIARKEEERVVDVMDFLEYFEDAEESDLYVHVTQSGAVKVLTIHKSKGLEFPAVIIPFLGMEVQVGARKGAFLVSAQKEGLKLMRLKKRYMDFSENLEEIYRQEYKRAFIDELNNAYVALTRAKEEMHIFIPEKTAKNVNLARFLVPEEIQGRGTRRIVPVKPVMPSGALVGIFPGVYHDWLEILRDEFMDKNEILRRESLRKGEIIHYILAHLGRVTSQNRDDAVRDALKKAKLAFGEDKVSTEYKGLVTRLLKDPRLGDFFSEDSGVVFTEKEIVDSSGKTSRIDRLLVRDNEVLVVDYKSSADDPPRYAQQMVGYMKLMKAIYPKKRVRGFLVYLDDVRVEEL